jgi:UDP-glucose 4-epimerase
VANMIFSSSAAVYGMPTVEVVTETTECRPINPYGETKLVGEWMLADCERAWGLRWAGLRYFNVAGAGWPELGDPAVLNLVPMVLDRLAKGERPKIFGDDYPTPDGTCIRDYIHVLDLAHAHLAAMDHLSSDVPLGDRVFNVGTGAGASVRQVIEEIGAVSGLDVTADVEPRRPGDPPQLIASPDLIGDVLSWKAEHGLTDIIRSAWEAWQTGPRRIG